MKDHGKDYLTQRHRQNGSKTLTPKVLRQTHSASLPANTEIIQGKGGSVVFRTRIGGRVTENIS